MATTLLVTALVGCVQPNPARCDMDDCADGGGDAASGDASTSGGVSTGDAGGGTTESGTTGDETSTAGGDDGELPELGPVRVDGLTNPPPYDAPKLLRLETDPVDGVATLRFVVDGEQELPASVGPTGVPFADWLISGERFDGQHELRVRGDAEGGATVEGDATLVDVDMPPGGTTIGIELVTGLAEGAPDIPISMALDPQTSVLTLLVERSGPQAPDIQALRLTAPTLVNGASSDLFTTAGTPQRAGDVAMHPEGSVVFIGWRAAMDDPAVFIEHREANGTLIDVFSPPIPFGFAAFDDAAVAVDAAGNIVYAYRGRLDNGDKVGAYGTVPANGGAIEQASTSALPHDISIDGEGRILLTGERDTGELWLLRTSLGGDIDVSAGAEFPGAVGRRVIEDPNSGELVVVGSVAVDSLDTEARVWVFSSDGAFLRSMPVVPVPAEEGVATDVVFDPYGELVVLAQDGYSLDVASDLPDLLYVTKFEVDGSVRWTTTITNGANIFSALSGVSLAVDPLGWLYVTGEDDEDGDDVSRIALRLLAP